MKLVVGLGNPGGNYEWTRHNIGFLALDHFASGHGFDWAAKPKFKAALAEGTVGGEKVILLKPDTYMNLSGQAVSAIASFYKVDAGNILIIHDDADIDFGKVRLVQGGNDAGHRGIMSLNEQGLVNCWRLKVGVSNERRLPGQAIDFVLTKFEPAEREELPKLLDVLASRIEQFIESRPMTETFAWR